MSGQHSLFGRCGKEKILPTGNRTLDIQPHATYNIIINVNVLYYYLFKFVFWEVVISNFSLLFFVCAVSVIGHLAVGAAH
jgi:hypothetical protein